MKTKNNSVGKLPGKQVLAILTLVLLLLMVYTAGAQKNGVLNLEVALTFRPKILACQILKPAWALKAPSLTLAWTINYYFPPELLLTLSFIQICVCKSC
ncbi:MAG: hypothetical protein JWP81_4519 [Ferruginibacter sp.]|nr:hypothetical protein [Ferruginibacter sp.]